MNAIPKSNQLTHLLRKQADHFAYNYQKIEIPITFKSCF
jgi:hypothetical protein